MAVRKLWEERRESIRNTRIKKNCVEEVATDVCLSRRMKQTLIDMAVVRRLAAKQRLFSLLEYDITASRKRTENDTKPGEEPRNRLAKA